MAYPIHPDDIESPRTGTWCDMFNTYAEACEYYGAETPAQLAAEDEWRLREEIARSLDDMEARGGPEYVAPWHGSAYPLPALPDPFADMPF